MLFSDSQLSTNEHALVLSLLQVNSFDHKIEKVLMAALQNVIHWITDV